MDKNCCISGGYWNTKRSIIAAIIHGWCIRCWRLASALPVWKLCCPPVVTQTLLQERQAVLSALKHTKQQAQTIIFWWQFRLWICRCFRHRLRLQCVPAESSTVHLTRSYAEQKMLEISDLHRLFLFLYLVWMGHSVACIVFYGWLMSTTILKQKM